MFLPWSRLAPGAPCRLDATLDHVGADRGGRGLVAVLTLERDTPITLKAGTVLIVPVVDALLERLPATPPGTRLTIECLGPIELAPPRRQRPRARARWLGFRVEPERR